MGSELTANNISFTDALKILGIEDYEERILKSNSRGEIFHIYEYISMAQDFKGNPKEFRDWFENIVKLAEEQWERPESIFQHIFGILENN